MLRDVAIIALVSSYLPGQVKDILRNSRRQTHRRKKAYASGIWCGHYFGNFNFFGIFANLKVNPAPAIINTADKNVSSIAFSAAFLNSNAPPLCLDGAEIFNLKIAQIFATAS